MVIFVGKQSEFNLVFNLCSTEKSEIRKRKLGIWEFSVAKKVIFFFSSHEFSYWVRMPYNKEIISFYAYFLLSFSCPDVWYPVCCLHLFQHIIFHTKSTLWPHYAERRPSPLRLLSISWLLSRPADCVSSTMTTEQSFCSHEILSIRELSPHEAVSRLCRPARTECWWKWESKAVIMIPNRRRKRASEAVAAFQIP